MRGEDRREQILEAAIRAFSEHGYENTSIRIICEQAGIARGTLYQYFRSKQNLFCELVQFYTQRIKSFVQPYDPSDPYALNFEEFRTHRLLMFLEEIYNHREVYGIILRDAMRRNPQTQDMVLNLHQGFIDKIKQEYETANRLNLLTISDPEFAAVSLYGSLLMIIQKYILYTDQPVSPRILANKVSSLFVKSLSL